MAQPAPYRSLYRRFRPQRFAEVRGQDHVSRALRNAVREAKVCHAYLFSGPRGTGKTSTARILAKALNCNDVRDGEPCGECASCLAVQQGASLDVHELDAASHNGVEAMRDLVARAALGTPGRWKVYIVDEVHMLSTAASNALLKTLEEPPGHVVFVLATTDPQKVLPTIRSRTQHYEFRLLGGDVLGSLLADVNDAAGLGVAPEAIDLVVRRGKGSARDALSALDQVAAAGAVEEEPPLVDQLVEALCERDPAQALIAVAEGCAAGRDPRRLAVELLEHLRSALFATVAPGLVDLPDTAREQVEAQARRLGAPSVVRAMEALGQAVVDMRDAPDARICLETALVRLAGPGADVSTAALLSRVEALERQLAVHVTEPARATARQATTPPDQRPAPPAAQAGVAAARAAIGAPPARPPAAPPASAEPASAESASVPSAPDPPIAASPRASHPGLPSRDELTLAWGDVILGSLTGPAKPRFAAGRFVAVEADRALFGLPNRMHRDRCEEVKSDVEAALAAHFGRPVPLHLVVDHGDPPETSSPDDEVVELEGLTEADAALISPEDRLKQAFPGAEEVLQ